MNQKPRLYRILNRPISRHWFVCSLLICAGFAVLEVLVFRRDLRGRFGQAMAIVALGGGASVLLSALFHGIFQVGVRAICGDRVSSGTHLMRFLRPALIAALLFALCWWIVVIIAFPLTVIALGFSLQEAWAFLVSEPRLVILFVCSPLIFGLTSPIQAVQVYLHVRRRQPPAG